MILYIFLSFSGNSNRTLFDLMGFHEILWDLSLPKPSK